MSERKPYMEKPMLLTTGCRVSIQYRSTHNTDRTQSASGHVIADEDGVLVIEEYSNFSRDNPNRHILFEDETKDVYTQTENTTARIGQATKVTISAPPWDSTFDTVAAGWMMPARLGQDNEMQLVQEGIYEYVDPNTLHIPDDWSTEVTNENPLPEEKVEKNPETAYKPEYTTDI